MNFFKSNYVSRFWRISLLTLLFSGITFSIDAQNFTPQTEVLYGNKAKIGFNPYGFFFNHNGDGAVAVMPFTPTSNVATMYVGDLWLYAQDPLGNEYVSGAQYTSGGTQYTPGPLDNTGSTYPNGEENWNKIWKVSGAIVRDFVDTYNTHGSNINGIPDAIAAWPGKGNANFQAENGFPLPPLDLAPFFDRNNNDIYEPEFGDYPVFNSALPDAIADDLLWFVMNDQISSSIPNSQSLNAEVQVTAYAYSCNVNPLIDNAFFTNFKISNKNTSPWTKLAAGFFTDFDLGCSEDDYLGSHPASNSVFVYNGSNNDESCHGASAYGLNPPVLSMTYLDNSLDKFMYFPDNLTSTSLPNTAADYINYMNGRWRDGTPLGSSGNGYGGAAGNGIAFSGNPAQPTEWSMLQFGANPAEQRALPITEFQNVQPGTSVSYTAVHALHSSPGFSNLDNVGLMYNNIPLLQSFHDSGYQSALCPNLATCTDADCVWPGDTDNNGRAHSLDLLPIAVAYSETGSSRASISGNWTGLDGTDWSSSFPDGLNYKYADCYGDGIAGDDDIWVVKNNRGFYNSRYTTQAGSDAIGPELTFENVVLPPFLSGNPVLAPGENFRLKINLAQVKKLYGLGFTITYDPDLIELADPINQGLINNTWISPITSNLILFDGRSEGFTPGEIEILAARKDGIETIASGEILYITFKIKDNPPLTTAPYYSYVGIKNIKAIRADGTLLSVGSTSYSFAYSNNINGNQIITQSNTQVFPNPVTDVVHIASDQTISDLRIVNAIGEIVKTITINDTSVDIDLSALASGLYFIQLTNEAGPQVTRIVKK